MYTHSVKVPRLYKDSANILQKVVENGVNPKTLIFSSNHRNKKGLWVLVFATLQNLSNIDDLIEKVNLLTKERIKPWLARILIQELLWGKKKLPDESLPLKTILNYRTELEKYKSSLSKPSNNENLKKVNKPRAVRVNTIVSSLDKVVTNFRNNNWRLIPFTGTTYKEFVSQTAALNNDEFMVDIHFKELLQFPCNAALTNYEEYRDGSLILQDKASCLPTYLLNPEPGSTILDMCAAPGMKTTHLAALINNQGTIYAVDKDAKRLETLHAMVKRSKATCIKTIHKDVLKLSAEDVPNVKYILADPSCTGSGMTDRLELNKKSVSIKERLQKLAGFQIIILKHALKHFPHAQRVVYSTCSIYSEENEYVVQEALLYQDDFELVDAHKLVEGPWKSTNCNEDWKHISEKCLTMKPERDLTNGFFVAVFERIQKQIEVEVDNIHKQTKGETVENNNKPEGEVGKEVLNNSETDEPLNTPLRDNGLHKIQVLDSVNVTVSNAVLNDIKESVNGNKVGTISTLVETQSMLSMPDQNNKKGARNISNSESNLLKVQKGFTHKVLSTPKKKMKH